jgi:hypothetical protein
METGFLAYTEFTRSTDMSFQPQLLFVLAVLVLSETGSVGFYWMKQMLGGLKWLLVPAHYRVLSNSFLFLCLGLAGNAGQGMTTDRAFTTTND